jgi:hypothetical protein
LSLQLIIIILIKGKIGEKKQTKRGRVLFSRVCEYGPISYHAHFKGVLDMNM